MRSSHKVGSHRWIVAVLLGMLLMGCVTGNGAGTSGEQLRTLPSYDRPYYDLETSGALNKATELSETFWSQRHDFHGLIPFLRAAINTPANRGPVKEIVSSSTGSKSESTVSVDVLSSSVAVLAGWGYTPTYKGTIVVGGSATCWAVLVLMTPQKLPVFRAYASSRESGPHYFDAVASATHPPPPTHGNQYFGTAGYP